MPYRNEKQYEVLGGKAKQSKRNATYEYTTGNEINTRTRKSTGKKND